MIPQLDLNRLNDRQPDEMARLGRAVREIGFLTVSGTSLTSERVEHVIDLYRQFFCLPATEKRSVDMSQTGSNRGWGAPLSEQVDPNANPDFKEVFDCGYELPAGHPLAAKGLSVYAENLWPDRPAQFREDIQTYYAEALTVGRQILAAIAGVTGNDPFGFAEAFEAPMALLRGNFYPERPNWAGDKDFGIAAHTDYGCLTLLAMDGSPGLSVQMPNGSWQAITAQPGVFVINFGEMLQMWTGGQVKATSHRVVGGSNQRISVPLFLNPSYDTNVAPPGSDLTILAGEHLSQRFNETYLHLKSKA